ncbi:MAG: PHP domain-containing protein [Marinilabiliaceae bacterium]|nr:PHP domain-containing protein [Marinilabiliaceae bacterium]
MNRYKADLHIHSVLSPCGSLEMSPQMIVDAARTKGLDVIAITDHNSTRQCKVVAQLAKKEGIMVLCGAEVTTREEVHCVTLFESFEKLDAFQVYLDQHLPEVKNNPDVFGHQVWVNAKEEIMGQEDRLLISGLNQTIEEVQAKVHELNGLFVLAHVDKKRFSIYSQLGFLPFDLSIDAMEISPLAKVGELVKKHPEIKNYVLLRSSDAHMPDQIGQRYTEFLMEELSFDEIKLALRQENGRKTEIGN